MALFLAAALLRLAYLIQMRPAFDSLYWLLATSILHDGSMTIAGQSSTDFEPMYPLFLALSRLLTQDSVFWTQVLQALAASLGTVFAFRLALALTHRRTIAIVTAGLFACHPLLVRQASIASDLWLATTLVVAFAHIFVTSSSARSFALAGVVLGLVLLTRSMIMPLLVLAPAVLAGRRQFREAAVLVLAASVTFAPFALRNRSITGSWDPTRSGLNLFVGNSPFTDALLPDYDVDLLEEVADELLVQHGWPLEKRGTLEYAVASNRYLTTYVWDHVLDNPLHAAARVVRKAIYFFSPVVIPHFVTNDETRLSVNGGHVSVLNASRRPAVETFSYSLFHVPVLVAAAAGAYLRRREWRADAILWCILATFVGMHAIYFPATRYSAPAAFVLMFYAAVAAGELRDRLAASFPDQH